MGLYLGPFRFTKRGVRVRVGPRAARLHAGAGGTGFSTGAGPFTYYKRLGGKKSRSRRAPARRSAQAPSYAASQPPPPAYGIPGQPPPRSSVYDTRFGDVPPGPSRKQWSGRRRGLVVVGAIGALFLILIISAALSGGNKPTGNHTPGGNVPAVGVVSSSPPASSSAATSSPAAATSPAAAATTQPAPVVTTQAAPPPAPASCHPLTNGGNCYEPGEYCRDSDHGVIGLAGDGETIECEYNDGWRWEPI